MPRKATTTTTRHFSAFRFRFSWLPYPIEQQQQQQHEVNETPKKEEKKNAAKSKIAIFDGLFSCLLHLQQGGAAIMYWR